MCHLVLLNVPLQQGVTSKKARDQTSMGNPLAELGMDCIFDFSENIGSSSSGAGLEHHAPSTMEGKKTF